MPTTTTAETLSLVTRNVSVAPLVLLSAVDHYNRVVKLNQKRVVGVLLGQNDGKNVRVSNSFAVPFEEDEKDPNVWFIDHNYVESMYTMFKKVSMREKLIGWYHTGPKLRGSDLEINDMFKRYTPNPLLVIIDVQPKESGVPTDAYFAIEEIKDDGTATSRTFVHTPSIIEAEEAEEIGVEHLLRDIRDVAVGTLATRVTNQLQSLQGLHLHLRDIGAYLQKVLDGKLPVNHAILGNLQDVFNLLPNLSTPSSGGTGTSGAGELAYAMSVKTNDQVMAIYLSSLIRAITAFHDLIENKIQNRQQQEDKDKEAAAGDKKDEKKEDGKKEDGKKDAAAAAGAGSEAAKEGGAGEKDAPAKEDDKKKK